MKCARCEDNVDSTSSILCTQHLLWMKEYKRKWGKVDRRRKIAKGVCTYSGCIIEAQDHALMCKKHLKYFSDYQSRYKAKKE